MFARCKPIRRWSAWWTTNQSVDTPIQLSITSTHIKYLLHIQIGYLFYIDIESVDHFKYVLYLAANIIPCVIFKIVVNTGTGDTDSLTSDML